ncbi:hypothetical protein CLU80_4829 [Pseudomonas sp. 29]|uniref:hypothetical protein n=1 Tax=Pseudomonas sp. 29 TaxID=2035197 RepID=UPI000C5F370F|nr:hypothetical protein [Pseudomonas sp. 29]PIF52356.1 hypothetical protein CLU80_4829 [Pseudomonas sp. 29]
MDSFDIENTDDWLGCPTPLETCRPQLALYENEFEELNLQLRQSREQIFELVEMHPAVAIERDQLRTQLAAARSEAADANRKATDIETKSNWQLMSKDKHISELSTKHEAATGISVRTGQPIR